MTRSGIWLLRAVALGAAAGLVLVLAETSATIRAGTWFAVPDLAALEITIVAALGVAAMPLLATGRRALQLGAWTRAPGWPGLLERAALIWCASLAAVLGALPGLALDLCPPALWPPVLVALATVAARTVGSESPRRVAWLLCTSYGLAAAWSLVVVRHVF